VSGVCPWETFWDMSVGDYLGNFIGKYPEGSLTHRHRHT